MRLASTEDIPTETGLRVDTDTLRIALFRVDDEIFAIGDRCSHEEASLSEGDLFDDEVECPKHGSAFDVRTGAVLSLPATDPVPSYNVVVEDDDVYLLLEDQ
ncbi:MAG: Rieske 2Fe-2S domain-containing protein [Acidimicrobiia bacterium]|nr:Rieske 2Fe-2S domain-containing protein [Acidimicrobiia bacterium]